MQIIVAILFPSVNSQGFLNILLAKSKA